MPSVRSSLFGFIAKPVSHVCDFFIAASVLNVLGVVLWGAVKASKS